MSKLTHNVRAFLIFAVLRHRLYNIK